MENCLPLKTKRKVVDMVYDEFSSLSLYAPAAKARRLDAELLLDQGIRERVGNPVSQPQKFQGVTCAAGETTPVIENIPILPPIDNEERALVIYKPVQPQFGTCLHMDPKLFNGFKNSSFWSRNQSLLKQPDEEEQSSSCSSLAVVPWAPLVLGPSTQVSTSIISHGTVEEDGMDAVEVPELMEIEGECGQFVDPIVDAGGFHQWQQHCMIPELPQIPSGPPILGSW